MTPINLEDVESYLKEQAKRGGDLINRYELVIWITNRFAELRAREEAKTHVK